MRRAVLLGAIALGMVSAPARAQTSVYSVLGVGFPGRGISVRARGMGGGFSAFDPWSAVNPAAVAFQSQLGATFSSQTAFRRYTAAGVNVSGLRSTRFPLIMFAGPVPRTPLNFALGVVGYADRTFDVQTQDTLLLRGDSVAAVTRIRSDGGIIEVRGAAALNVSPTVKLGLALHAFSGSTMETIGRAFDNSLYATTLQSGDAAYTAWGLSAGAIVTPRPWLHLAASVRRDGRLHVTDNVLPDAAVRLPWTITAGAHVRFAAGLRWSATGAWRSWADAASAGALPGGASAFDTWEVGTGVELSGAGASLSRFPVRLGVRYAQLPFSPTAEQPHEVDLAAGGGVIFAAGHGLFDLSLERVSRNGGDASEHAWQISMQLTVRP